METVDGKRTASGRTHDRRESDKEMKKEVENGKKTKGYIRRNEL